MSWVDKAITVLWVLLVLYAQASYQAHRFDVDQKTIDHAGKATVFAILCLPLGLFFLLTGHPWPWLIKVPLLCAAERTAFFDPILNYYRIPRRSFWYNDAGKVESFFDRLENKLSAFWVKVLKLLYIVIFIFLLTYL